MIGIIPEPVEMADSPVTFDIKILKNSTCFRPRRAVGFDRASGAIEFNCPSGSKTCRIFQNFRVESDGTVRHFDGFRYSKNLAPSSPWSYKFRKRSTMISTSTGSWIRSRPSNVEIISNFSEIFMTKVAVQIKYDFIECTNHNVLLCTNSNDRSTLVA